MPATPDTSAENVARVLRETIPYVTETAYYLANELGKMAEASKADQLARAVTALADALDTPASEKALLGALTPEQWDERLVKAIKAERGQRNKIDGVAAALKAAFPELAPND